MLKSLQRFISDTNGAAALEFALIALPLMLFTFGIIEIGRALFMQQSLSYATDSAARLLYVNPAATPAVLSAEILESLFLADPDRLSVTVGVPPPSTETERFRSVLLQVDYDFYSVVPSLIIDQIGMHFERTVIVSR